MCGTCGCGRADPHAHDPPHAHDSPHDHEPSHVHAPDARETRLIEIEQDVLAFNAAEAERNRAWLRERGIAALNVMSSPGAGKTTLLERTLRDLAGELRAGVVEGDQATSRDAERIRATGAPAVQINTRTGCHLEAAGVGRALRELDPPGGSLVFIENVGNLVCPALFDLGESARVVVASVAEGDDKPEKYPYMFHDADVCVLNKTDLLPHVPFDPVRFRAAAHRVNPKLRHFELSALGGAGLGAWYGWLRALFASPARPRHRAAAPPG